MAGCIAFIDYYENFKKIARLFYYYSDDDYHEIVRICKKETQDFLESSIKAKAPPIT